MKHWDVPMLGSDIQADLHSTYTRFMRTQSPDARLDRFWAEIFGPISHSYCTVLCRKHI